ncbi:MAG: hypothetical protein K2M06_06075 [Muribaculaceae bacterium]|nr:hypothetical protein [Muribaculaceae bacterium]
MKRKLIQQMRNEWRSNIWMCVELVITGLVLWAIFSTFAVLLHMHQDPEGYDLTDIYAGNTGTLGEGAITFTPYPDSLHNEHTDFETLLTNLRNNPYVESVGAGNNALPYSYNYSGNLFEANINGERQQYGGNLRHMTPDMVRTIRMKGLNGETTEDLAQMIADGQTIISLFEASRYEGNPLEWRGRDVYWSYDSTRIEHIGAIVAGIRRTDYEPIFNGMILQRQPEQWVPDQVAIRVKPGKGREFMESIKAEDLEFGNVYITNLQSIEQLREQAHMNANEVIRTMTVSAIFVMTAVFLGFLGSFWFRTQQRVPELALRRVNGATRSDLFRRLLGEGMLILMMALPFVAGLGGLLLYRTDISAELNIPFPNYILWTGLPCAIGALGLMICAGILFPASKAMKVNPAEALKDQ